MASSNPRRRSSDKAAALAAAAQVVAGQGAAAQPQVESVAVGTPAQAPVAAPIPVAFGADGSPLFSCDLALIVAETQKPLTATSGFIYTVPAAIQFLVESGDVEINPSVVHPSGMLGTRATAQGISKMTQAQTQTAPQTQAAAPAAAPAAPKVEFEIETGVALPAIKRNSIGHGNTKYPFDKLEIGQSFFVPGGSVKKLASTVASANDRYSEEVPGQTRTNRKGKTVPVTKSLRRFVVRNDTKDGVAGARIGRVELKDEQPAQ